MFDNSLFRVAAWVFGIIVAVGGYLVFRGIEWVITHIVV